MNIRKHIKRRIKTLRLHLSKRSRNWGSYIRHRARHLKPGTIIETCGLDVARVTAIDGDDIEYETLAGRRIGGQGSCSIFNCGPIKLSAGAIERRKEIFKNDGHRGLQQRYFREDCKMTEEQIETYLKEWG